MTFATPSIFPNSIGLAVLERFVKYQREIIMVDIPNIWLTNTVTVHNHSSSQNHHHFAPRTILHLATRGEREG